ncbi:hypothetical protein Q5530_36465 [Saccharothrix sp. BKS2]|uniref:hypothetical protein n=1 Tax=Saccharothrix sp. BKS2 TaxID=3064400 RepID=UPI0039EABD99
MANSRRGRFHLEMHWWHGAHFPLWGRPELLVRALDWYPRVLGLARATARGQGLPGRAVAQAGRPGRAESPSPIGTFLLWQQPHPIHLPAVAMTATRLGEPRAAVDALLLDSPKNGYLPNGHNRRSARLPAYLPGNGGLPAAVALMAAGWDGGPPRPGFPDGWPVRHEGLVQAP